MLILLCLLCAPVLATDYYIKPDGSDGAAGTSWAAAWATIGKLNTSLSSGDTVYFGTGVWDDAQLLPTTGCTYACSTFDTDTKWDAKIYGGEILTEGWVQYSGNVYAHQWTGSGCYDGNSYPGSVAQDSVPMKGQTGIPDAAGEYYWTDTGDDTIYVWCWDDDDPNDCEMVVSCKAPVYFTGQQDSVRIWGLDLRYGKQAVIHNHTSSSHCKFEHCYLLQAGMHAAQANMACIFFSTGFYGKNSDDTTTWGFYNEVRSCYMNGGYTVGYDRIDGIVIYSEMYFQIDSNVIDGDTYPIWVGINIKGKGSGACCQSYVNVTNNIIEDPIESGIEVWVHPYMDSIYGNIVRNSDNHGISTPGSSNPWPGNIFILNNTIYNCGGSGVEIWESNSPDQYCGSGDHIWYNVTDDASFGVDFEGWTGSGCCDSSTIDSNLYSGVSLWRCYDGSGNFGTWQSTCGFDVNSDTGATGFDSIATCNFLNLREGARRSGASNEMNRTYGGRTWTVFGAVQPDTSGEEPPEPSGGSYVPVRH